jgi:hypothetical protein
MDVLLADATVRSAQSLRGSFAKKVVKGRDYWYYQFTDIDGSTRQVYLGPETERVRELIAASREGLADEEHLKASIAAVIKAGYATTPSKQFKIVSRLADYGFFAAGGVLAGTHAFIAIGSLLGVRWTDDSTTKDVDFAHAGKNIAIALPSNIRVDLYDAIESLEMGFVPIAAFNARKAASYVNRESKEERIDFLTTVTGLSSEPVFIKEIGIALQPLKFMELSLGKVERSAMLSSTGSGAVAINVPDPALFAIHKLIVAVERGVVNPKSVKDVTQSAAIIDFFADHDKQAFLDAWRETEGRGPGWKKRMNEGLGRLKALYPAVYKKIRGA